MGVPRSARRPPPKATPTSVAPPSPPPAASHRLCWLPFAIGLLVLVLLGAWWLHTSASTPTPPTTVTSASSSPVAVAAAPADPAPHYVGARACSARHQPEADAWRQSHHAQAMQVADAQTVAGNFNNAMLKQDGTQANFFKRDHAYFVKTDGPDGKPGEFEVKYTFGVYPLQQYLVRSPMDACRPCAPAGMHARPRRVASTGSTVSRRAH